MNIFVRANQLTLRGSLQEVMSALEEICTSTKHITLSEYLANRLEKNLSATSDREKGPPDMDERK